MRSLATVLSGRRVRNDSPVPLAQRGTSGGGSLLTPQSNGYFEQMMMYSQISGLYSIVLRIMTSTAKVRWHLYARAASGLDEDRVEIMPGKHPALDLWDAPNPFMGQSDLVKRLVQHKLLTGEMNAVVGYAGSLPLELWPIRPDRIQPVPDPYKFLTGWVYTGPSGERVPIELNELIRSIYPGPIDPYRGISPVKPLFDDLLTQAQRRAWEQAFFTNSARPNGLIQIDKRLDDDEFNEMAARWAEQHRGVNKAHKVAIIEQGSQWVETSMNMQQMQFAELSDADLQRALVAFGMPKFAIGMVDDVNRANADASENFYSKWLIGPQLDDVKDMLNGQVLKLYGADQPQRYEFDYDSPVTDDDQQLLAEITTKSAALGSLAGAGFDVPEVEEWLDMPEIPYTRPVAPMPGNQGQENPIEKEDDSLAEKAAAGRGTNALPGEFDLAMRWVVDAHKDDNTCQPCLDNDGKTYRNRAAAYTDYPDGSSYVHCVGEEFGNHCRCKVIKRRKRS